MEVVTKTAHQTQKIGEKLGKTLKGGDVVAMYGDLGAGKTVLTKGIANGLGIKKRILSPTFIFVRSYPLTASRQSLTFHHVDLYRARNTSDLQTLGLPEIFSPNSIVVIEWADRLGKNLPKKSWKVNISKASLRVEKVDEGRRRITITSPQYSSSDRAKRGSREVTLENLKKAANILKSDGVVIFPTDTVYGIGCRWDRPKSVERIYQIKNTPKTQSFPTLVSSIDQAKEIVLINNQAQKLMDKYWPGALTIILPAKAAKKKIGVRLPDSVTTRALIEQVGAPIIGTSANIHGNAAVKSSSELDPKLTKQVDSVLEGECEDGVESTVVDATFNPPKILRQGAIQIDTFEVD